MLVALERIVLARGHAAGEAAATWLERALAQTAPAALAGAFALAPRKLGTTLLAPDEREALGWLADGATIDEIARVLLLARAVGGGEDGVAIAAEWYRLGDNAEKRAVLRALSLLPSPERYVEVGATSCRSSVQSVFEAIACENPYPAAHFSELAFNQLVLKALFTGVALARVIGLGDRKNSELGRMATDFASERIAAGRVVPPDIGLAMDGESFDSTRNA